MWQTKEKRNVLIEEGEGGDLNYSDEKESDKQNDSGIRKIKNCSLERWLKDHYTIHLNLI